MAVINASKELKTGIGDEFFQQLCDSITRVTEHLLNTEKRLTNLHQLSKDRSLDVDLRFNYQQDLSMLKEEFVAQVNYLKGLSHVKDLYLKYNV